MIMTATALSFPKRRRHGTSRDAEAEGSAKTTHHTPATRARHQEIKCIYDSTKQSGEARPITAQRLHSNPLPGTGVLQETVRSSEKEQSKEKLETQHDSRRMQQIELQSGRIADGGEEHAIPRTLTKRRLTKRQRSMLRTDLEGGVIRCKLCPNVKLSSWQCYRRHCDTSRDHPAKLTFCDQCGDYFGRRDSKMRHNTRENQDECSTTPRDKAELKKRVVKRIFEDFNTKLERCLKTGEELGTRFAVMIAKAKVPTTSKEAWSGGHS